MIRAGNLLQALEAIRTINPEVQAEQVPARFAPLLRHALASEPSRRTITMREIADQLTLALKDLPSRGQLLNPSGKNLSQGSLLTTETRSCSEEG